MLSPARVHHSTMLCCFSAPWSKPAGSSTVTPSWPWPWGCQHGSTASLSICATSLALWLVQEKWGLPNAMGHTICFLRFLKHRRLLQSHRKETAFFSPLVWQQMPEDGSRAKKWSLMFVCHAYTYSNPLIPHCSLWCIGTLWPCTIRHMHYSNIFPHALLQKLPV